MYICINCQFGTLNEKKFVCDVKDCNKSYTRMFGLKQHLLTHGGPKHREHICGYKGCGRAYTFRGDLQKHQKLHLDPKNCDICGKKFGTNTTLEMHKISHTEDRPFACEWPGCHFKSKIKYALAPHLRTHTLVQNCIFLSNIYELFLQL